MQIDDNALAVAAASTRAGTFSALTMGEHRDICRAAITAYLQALAPPQMVKLSPEDERLLEKALSASRTAVYEIVPASLSPGSTGETEGWVLVPKEPTPELLHSMAVRYDHGLGVPGYYDQPVFGAENVGHAKRLESTIRTMRQLHEEVVGTGFYRAPSAMLSAAGERG